MTVFMAFANMPFFRNVGRDTCYNDPKESLY